MAALVRGARRAPFVRRERRKTQWGAGAQPTDVSTLAAASFVLDSSQSLITTRPSSTTDATILFCLQSHLNSSVKHKQHTQHQDVL